MATKHTPGPWFAALDPVHFPDLVHTKAPKGHWAGKLVGVGRAQPDGDFAEACANAHLIAAAPELLEACKQALIVMTNYPIYCEEQHVLCDEKHETPGCSICKVIRALSAAIAKARGESCQ